jgi:hypothetical protein
VQHDLETGQTIDPSVGVEGPEAVHPQVAFASEILANIDARLTAERAEALTGEGGASSGLAEMEARHPFAGASGQSAQPNEIGPMTDAELGFWQTLGGAYLGARVPSGPAHAVGALTLASAESHDDPSFVLGTMAVLPGMPAVSQALDRAAGAAADLAYQSAFMFTGVGGGSKPSGPTVVRSEHAKLRAAEGRPVGTAITDVRNARGADVFIQEDGRFIVRGPNGREHVIDPSGELVTTIPRRTKAAHQQRLADEKIRPATVEELERIKNMAQ